MHVFPYSIRKGTVASKLKNQIDGNVKKERARKLINLSTELEKRYMNKFINTETEVLVERSKDGFSYGHTSNYLSVKLDGNYNSEDVAKELVNQK